MTTTNISSFRTTPNMYVHPSSTRHSERKSSWGRELPSSSNALSSFSLLQPANLIPELCRGFYSERSFVLVVQARNRTESDTTRPDLGLTSVIHR